jgi:hypothetical protein
MSLARQAAMALLMVASLPLAVPDTASAHSRAPTIALDVRLRLGPLTRELRAVRADVIDGNRRLRLRVDPSVSLLVRGLLGEPFLRFAADGVWANLHSPTTAADRIAPGRKGTGWLRLTRGHSFTWHDHRLAPPRGLPVGSTAPFAVPVFVDGRTSAIRGAFVHVPRPAWWPWLAGAVAVLAAAVVLARRAASSRIRLAWTAAGAAASGALAASASFVTADPIASIGEWVQVGMCAGLVLLVCALAPRSESTGAWAASLIGASAAVLSLRELVVFWHGVVISSLSPSLTRLAVAAALVGGFAAAGISFAADAGERASADDP